MAGFNVRVDSHHLPLSTVFPPVWSILGRGIAIAISGWYIPSINRQFPPLALEKIT
jgi:hypothetical protein